MDPGTGKTITALRVVEKRNQRNSVTRILIFCPKNAMGGWRRQIIRHMDPPYRILERTTFEEALIIDDDVVKFVIMNYEQSWRCLQSLIHADFDMVIADEGHRLKKYSSKQSKALWKLGLAIKYKLLLTGTPIGKDERDLWPQFRFVDRSLLGDNWFKFDRRYLKRSGFGGYERKFKPKMKEKLLDIVSDNTYYVSADILELPPSTDCELIYELTGKSKTLYNKMEKDFFAEFGDYTITSPLAVTNMIRLQQLCSGYVKLDSGELLQLEQDKLLALADWLDDNVPVDEKLVIFARFTHEIDMLCELMEEQGRSYIVRDGRTKKEHQDDWMIFQDEPHLKVYIAQISSGGEGIDLFASRFCVFYSCTFSYINYKQARARPLRNGQRRNVLFLHLLSEFTIDNDIYSSLYNNRLTEQSVQQHLVNRRLLMAKGKEAPAKPAKEEKPAKAAAEVKSAKGKEAPALAKKKGPPPIEKPEYGIDQLAEALGVDSMPALRMRLRAIDGLQGQYKKGRLWDFGSKKNLDAVVKQLAKK